LAYRTNGDSFMYVHTTCLNLSEALSGHYPFYLSPDCARFARLVWGY